MNAAAAGSSFQTEFIIFLIEIDENENFNRFSDIADISHNIGFSITSFIKFSTLVLLLL